MSMTESQRRAQFGIRQTDWLETTRRMIAGAPAPRSEPAQQIAKPKPRKNAPTRMVAERMARLVDALQHGRWITRTEAYVAADLHENAGRAALERLVRDGTVERKVTGKRMSIIRLVAPESRGAAVSGGTG